MAISLPSDAATGLPQRIAAAAPESEPLQSPLAAQLTSVAGGSNYCA
jgi:hypothetical protein